MVCIVKQSTKKQLIEDVKNNKEFYIEDPSIVNPRYFSVQDIKDSESEVVTNHPERSWFASIRRKNGKLMVR